MFHHVRNCHRFRLLQICIFFFGLSYMHNFHTPWVICCVNKISLITTINAKSSSTTLYYSELALVKKINGHACLGFLTRSITSYARRPLNLPKSEKRETFKDIMYVVTMDTPIVLSLEETGRGSVIVKCNLMRGLVETRW